MKARTITQILLGAAAIVLAYFIFEGIMKPQRFETLKSRREVEVVNRLKDIRAAELAYRNVYGNFCGSLDTLILFLENGKLPTVKSTGRDELADSLMLLSDTELLKRKLIRRDTIFSNAYFVLFPPDSIKERGMTEMEKEQFRATEKQKHLTTLRYIPFTGRTKEFNIEVGYIDRSGVQVPVIEVSAKMTDYLVEKVDDGEYQLISNYRQLIRNTIKRTEDLERFPGVKFGSMIDPQTEGNWE